MKKILIASLFALALFAGCVHEFDHPLDGTGTLPNDTTTVYVNPHPCDPDTVYFTNDILPFITSNCAMSGCHDASPAGEPDPYTTYSQIRNDRGDILNEMQDGNMPPANSGVSISAAQIQMFQTWMSQGALNNSCIADCDPNVAPTFAAVIHPVIQNNCQGCHSGSSPSGGVSLTDWTSISNAGLNGNLVNCLSGTNGVSIMPPNSGGLPTCVQTQITTWVSAGAPNN